ncbi:hypothetical protein [Candidatus Pelagibacter sp. Uisw_137]|uniref:hypothetical protein n=1 Tax=Candidatus Pelagibacter sp. Uisw_137 TaxID=3230992 RepID=UPI0039E75F7C
MKNDTKNIYILTTFLFLTKWFFVLNSNFEIDLITKIIFYLDDRQYFTLIYNLATLNFNPTYNPELTDTKYIPLPIYSILFHSLFFKLFNIYGFIIIEFFIILSFCFIFFKIFASLGLGRIENIFLVLFIFCLPNIIDYFHLFKIPYVSSIKDLYNLRIPRPAITNLYLFLFFYILVTKNKKIKFKYLDLTLIGIIFGLMWGSYYYNLAISGITFLIYYFYIIHGSNQKIVNYLRDASIIFVFFIIFSIPVILFLINSEPDYLVRVGLIELTFLKKKILLNHFIDKIFTLEFILIFICITSLYIFLKYKSIFRLESLSLLFIIFLSSFIGPIIFIVISPTISEIYNFSNMIVALTFLIFVIFLYLTLLTILKKNIKIVQHILKAFIVFLLLIHALHYFTLNKNNLLDVKKIHTKELMNTIKKLNINKEASILVFDDDIQINLILNGYKNLNFVTGVHSSLSDAQLESQIINIFRFLELNKNDFMNFIKNKKEGWRYYNDKIGKTFYMKYQANKLITYNGSFDFSEDEMKAISKSSPLNSQQVIIPAFETKRLIEKFINFKTSKMIKPDLVILMLKFDNVKNITIDEKLYCIKKINNTFMIYFSKSLVPTCPSQLIDFTK